MNHLKHLYYLAGLGGTIRFIKFCFVGVSGTFVYLGLLSLFTEVVGLFYIISAAVSYETSIITNFVLNDIWTFRDRRSHGMRKILYRGLKFNLVSLVGLGIHMAILWFFTEVVGLFYLLSAIFAIAGALSWNFFINTLWTWRAKPHRGL